MLPQLDDCLLRQLFLLLLVAAEDVVPHDALVLKCAVGLSQDDKQLRDKPECGFPVPRTTPQFPTTDQLFLLLINKDAYSRSQLLFYHIKTYIPNSLI